jgi:K+-transporting ATPase ATPase A chain
MTRVFKSECILLSPVLAPVECGLYNLAGIDERQKQHGTTDAVAMLAFAFAGFVVLYALLRLQAFLPLNSQALDAVAPDLAFNISVCFVINTNW